MSSHSASSMSFSKTEKKKWLESQEGLWSVCCLGCNDIMLLSYWLYEQAQPSSSHVWKVPFSSVLWFLDLTGMELFIYISDCLDAIVNCIVLEFYFLSVRLDPSALIHLCVTSGSFSGQIPLSFNIDCK